MNDCAVAIADASTWNGVELEIQLGAFACWHDSALL